MKYLIALISLLLLISCNSNIKNDDVVASWRGGQITLKEYEDFALYYAFDYESDTAAKSTFYKRREILTDMINFKMIELLADSLQLDTMKVMKESYDRKLGSISFVHHLYVDSVRRKVFPDDEIKKVYDKMKYEYFVSHILLKCNENNEEQIKLKIDSLYAEIVKNPDSFRSIAGKYSEDEGSGSQGGDLGWNLTPNFVPEFDNQIIRLKTGEISKPFKTDFGWHIAILKDRRKTKLESFEREKGKITAYLIKKNQDKHNEAFDDFKIFLFKKYRVESNDSVISQFVNRFKFNFKNNIDVSSGFTDLDKSEVIASFEGINITVDDALKHFSEGDKEILQNFSANNVNDLILNIYYTRLTYLSAIDLGYSTMPDVLKLVEEGMIIDHQDYFTDRFLGKNEEKDKWYKELYLNYNLSVNHYILEKSFESVQAFDDRK